MRNNPKNKGMRLRFVELYGVFLEVEEAIEGLRILLEPEEIEDGISGEVEESLERALYHFMMDYERLPDLNLPESIEEKMKRTIKKMEQEIQRGEDLYSF